jgi:hypothetical protein
MIRPVEAGSGEVALQPPEQSFVPDVHAECDLRLAPVSSEMPLTGQDAEQEADVSLT